MEFPGEKLVIKMWETIFDKGIASWLQPWHEKRVAKAKIKIRELDMLALAKAEKLVG